MKNSLAHPATFGAAAFALALGLGGTISVWAEEPAKSPTQPDQSIQDRAVPRLAPNTPFQPAQPLQPLQPPPRRQQGIVQNGNTIVAQPGHVLEPGPNNQVTARIAGGGGGGRGVTSMTCGCVHNDGHKFETWPVFMSGTTVTCSKSEKDTCQSTCAWTSGGAGFRPGGKAMQ